MYGHIFVVIIMRFIVMNNGNGPPARIQFQKSVDGKLNSHLEWPKVMGKRLFKITTSRSTSVGVDKAIAHHALSICPIPV